MLCDNPDYPNDNGNSVITPPEPWPLCEPLECVCLGNRSLSSQQGLNITRTSCPSEDTVNKYLDVSNFTYTIPKREHCGTFKAEDPTFANKCECPELDEGKKNFNILCCSNIKSLMNFFLSFFCPRSNNSVSKFTFYLFRIVTIISFFGQKLDKNQLLKI